MTWVTFEVAGGGLVAVHRQDVVAIYDEQGVVKLSTTACGVHVLKDTTVQHAATKLIEAAEAAPSVLTHSADSLSHPSQARQGAWSVRLSQSTRLPREPAPSTPSCLATRSQ
jgi:hypothetical protein